MAATTTYHIPASTSALREDLLDVITSLNPADNWAFKNTGDSTAKSTYHEWLQLDVSAGAANTAAEGATVTPAVSTAPSRTGNYTQIIQKTYAVSDTMEEVDYAGMDSPKAFYMQKAMKEWENDAEYAIVINATSSAATSATGRLSKGFIGWIGTNTASASATGVDLADTLVNSTLQDIWADAGPQSYDIMVGGYNKRKISAFTGNTRNITAAEKKQNAVLDVYESDFGVCRIHLSMALQANSAGTVIILGDCGTYWKKAWSRKPKEYSLGRTGNFMGYFIEGEFALEARQEKTAGRIISTKTA
jgi:hypothetical protein